MTAALVVAAVLALLGWGLAGLLGWKWYELGRRVLEMERQVEESLDLLDGHYGRLATILDVPMAADDQIARDAVAAIKDAHEAVLLVANKLTENEAAQAVEDEGDEDDE